jgi:hypothetical protein
MVPGADSVRGFRQTLFMCIPGQLKPKANLTLNLGALRIRRRREVDGKTIALASLSDSRFDGFGYVRQPDLQGGGAAGGARLDPFVADGGRQPKLRRFPLNQLRHIARNPPQMVLARPEPSQLPERLRPSRAGCQECRRPRRETDPARPHTAAAESERAAAGRSVEHGDGRLRRLRGIHPPLEADMNTAIGEIPPDGRKFFAPNLPVRNPAFGASGT